ncbi:hypothetical protein F5X68DRAFT_261113 [Plectosphaerella plurivora]|uniref:Uncharacterized protein n=1 Tax=Plectosphaerella plurivora TaxID=936078 RepID=A0A9P9ACY0_9PEZI|nr:hypothetical protein F5X68DRAFT_261113 [Plectosphaerella plurivora]
MDVDSPRSHLFVSKMPGVGPLTEAEREWLKKHYGNEFHFLGSYGLSIYKDDDREEGRRILRGLMSVDAGK